MFLRKARQTPRGRALLGTPLLSRERLTLLLSLLIMLFEGPQGLEYFDSYRLASNRLCAILGFDEFNQHTPMFRFSLEKYRREKHRSLQKLCNIETH